MMRTNYLYLKLSLNLNLKLSLNLNLKLSLDFNLLSTEDIDYINTLLKQILQTSQFICRMRIIINS